MTAVLEAEADVTDEERSAAVTLADAATIVTCWDPDAEESGAWDEAAAKEILTELLQMCGFAPYDSVPWEHKGIKTLSTNYLPLGRD